MSFHVNPYRVALKLGEYYRRKWKDSSFPVTKREIELENALKGLIDDFVAGKTTVIEEEESVLEDNLAGSGSMMTSENFLEVDTCSPLPSSSDQQSASPYNPSPIEITKAEYPSWEKVIEAVSFWRSTKGHHIKKKKAHLDIVTVQNSFRFVKDDRQLYRWEKMINMNDSPREYKLARLANAVREDFQKFRDKQLAVHDRDLMRWSLYSAKMLNIPDFKCSPFWLRTFKKASRISSRKVTKFVSRAMFENTENVVSQAEEFVLQVQELIQEFGAENVYNMDQSGFERCMVSRNTLAETGSSSVKVVAQSTSALTHTYTVQPTISASGRLVTPVALCLQEPTGNFGPVVRKSMFKCPELIYPIASKSGKMGREQLTDWFLNVMIPAAGNRFVLLVDSYSGHKFLEELIPETHNIQIIPIPPGATGLIQPLDVHGFRYWKDMARHFNKEAMAGDEDIPMYSRDPIMQMQSLIVRFLSNPKLQNFWIFAWSKCGYLLDDPQSHKSPMQVLVGETATCCMCSNIMCVQCPWCEKPLCFEHCFIQLHVNCNP